MNLKSQAPLYRFVAAISIAGLVLTTSAALAEVDSPAHLLTGAGLVQADENQARTDQTARETQARAETSTDIERRVEQRLPSGICEQWCTDDDDADRPKQARKADAARNKQSRAETPADIEHWVEQRLPSGICEQWCVEHYYADRLRKARASAEDAEHIVPATGTRSP